MICETNECGYWGADQLGRVGCRLIKGCPCRITDHIMIGGGCLRKSDPLFLSSQRYEEMPDDKKTKSLSEAEVPQIKGGSTKQFQHTPYSTSSMGMHGGNPDVTGIVTIGNALESMTPQGRISAIQWATSMYLADECE